MIFVIRGIPVTGNRNNNTQYTTIKSKQIQLPKIDRSIELNFSHWKRMTILLVAHENRKQNVSKYFFFHFFFPFCHSDRFAMFLVVTRFCSCYSQFLLISIDVLIKREILFLGRTHWEVFCLVLWYIQSNDQINRNKEQKQINRETEK